MASSKNNKSSGLRILWIPGKSRNRSHSKGRFDSTNKQISYNQKQKGNEMWSLGGSKAQKDMLSTDSNHSLLEGPSVSTALAPVTCAVGAVGATNAVCHASEDNKSAKSTTEHNNPPSTPLSTTSTAPLISIPNSPESTTSSTTTTTTTTTADIMPTKTPVPVIITTTATAEIIDENRFAILGKNLTNEIDVYDLPSLPSLRLDDNLSEKEIAMLNNSAGTTASTTSTLSPSGSSKNASTKGDETLELTPTKKRYPHANSNHKHQNDVNNILCLEDDVPTIDDLDFIDDMIAEQNVENSLQRSKHKNKKKKKHGSVKQLDQLDGVPTKKNEKEQPQDDDEKVVKCLYYTLMCCECSIS